MNRARPRIGSSVLVALLSLGSLSIPISTSAQDSTPRARDAELVVIVHASRAVELSKTALAQIFLRQRRFWSDGTPILPVNRPADSPARETFSRAIYGAGSRAHLAYWNRSYFQGLLPPITLDSDRAVVVYVARHDRAIGYVRADAVAPGVAIAARLGPIAHEASPRKPPRPPGRAP